MAKTKKPTVEMRFWKALVNFWSVITAVVFLTTFFKVYDLSNILSSVSIIYITILSIFTGIKEFSRWRSQKKFLSRYNGEIFIVAWTLIMVIFMFVAAIYPEHKIYGQFTATYLSVLGIFGVSLKSKTLWKK